VIATKTCKSCGESKPVPLFRLRDGRHVGTCKRCEYEKVKAKRALPGYSRREESAKRYQLHKKAIAVVSKAWYQRTKGKYYETRKAYSLAHRRERLNYDLKTSYGLTVEAYESMLASQGGVCAICGGVSVSGRRLAVDHDHDTGLVRALLCDTCNASIGFARDDPSLLDRMAQYLRMHGRTGRNGA
jgi:hypothetical protein